MIILRSCVFCKSRTQGSESNIQGQIHNTKMLIVFRSFFRNIVILWYSTVFYLKNIIFMYNANIPCLFESSARTGEPRGRGSSGGRRGWWKARNGAGNLRRVSFAGIFFSKFGIAETRFYVFEFKYLLFIPGNVLYASFFLLSRVNLLRNRDCS